MDALSNSHTPQVLLSMPPKVLCDTGCIIPIADIELAVNAFDLGFHDID
jgi:hypothetical protein